jgi:hypothetical protein
MAVPTGPEILTLSYAEEGTLQVPQAEAQLWRFMDLAKLVAMLGHNALYFPAGSPER